MLRRILIAGLLVNGLVQPAQAAGVRELNRSELRRNVKSGQYLGLSQLLEFIEKSVNGDLIDVRAFDADGIIYRVLIMTPAGKLASVIVDAKTGKFLANNSSRAVEVRELASSSRGKKLGVGNNSTSGNNTNRGNSGGKGNNGGGNGGGNSGGNGGGNGKK